MIKFRLLVAAALLLLSVLVDFTSKILSVASDGVLVGLAVFIAWPFIKAAMSNKGKGAGNEA